MHRLHPRNNYQRAATGDESEYHGLEMTLYDRKLPFTTVQTVQDAHTNRTPTGLASTVLPTTISTRLAGWRLGSFLSALAAVVSLVINVLAVAVLERHQNADTKLVQIYTGSCQRVTTMTIWIHLAINALSTVLLAGSNYCMQCLCAPTRQDVDKAHAAGRYLDIGVPSIRNLKSIGSSKLALWWILGLSSIPLHLM